MSDTKIKGASAQENQISEGEVGESSNEQLNAMFTEKVALALGDQLAPKAYSKYKYENGVFSQEWRFECAGAPTIQQLEPAEGSEMATRTDRGDAE